jgi:VanZ family protein
VIKFGGALNTTKIGIGSLKFRLDHVLHASAYFVFSMYYLFGQIFGLRLFKHRTHIFFFFLLFVVGFLAEAIQIWVPYRSFTLLDLFSNLVGIGVGYGVTVMLTIKLNL